MGTLFRKATWTSVAIAAAFAAFLPTTSNATGTQPVPQEQPEATATNVGVPARGRLVVVETRAIDSTRGWLVYTDGRANDSTQVEIRLLQQLKPGDVLSDSEGVIER